MRHRTRRRAPAIPLLLALALVAAACDDQQRTLGPTVLGTPRASATRLQIRADPHTAVPPEAWPSACRLLTDTEIKSLLPQADRISRNAMPFAGSHDDPGSSTAPEGSCTYSFWLRGSVPATSRSVVTVTILAVAGEPVIAARYTQDLAHEHVRTDSRRITNLGASAGPQACYTYLRAQQSSLVSAGTPAVVVCRQGTLMWEVDGYGAANFPGVNGLEDQREYWRTTVLTPLSALIAAKVPAAS